MAPPAGLRRPGGAGKKEKDGMLNQQTMYALGVMMISVICFSALLRANKKAVPMQTKIDPADLEFNANAKQSCVCHSTDKPDAVAECAGHSDQPWCFVNKTCPGSRPRTESPGLHWKYCDVGEKVTLPLLLPSIAQEIADALAKKPLTVAKRNELAIERARTFKHEDDIDVMVLLKRSIMTALENCEMTILRGLNNDEHAKAYTALLDQQLQGIDHTATSLMIKKKLYEAAHSELASNNKILPRMTAIKEFNKKAKKTIAIGKLMTTPPQKTDADTILLAAEWDGLSPAQIKAYIQYCFFREMVVALEIASHVKKNRSKRSRSSEDDDFFVTVILLTVGVIVLYFGGSKSQALYKDWTKKSQASKKRRDAAKKAAIDDTEIKLPDKTTTRQSSQTEHKLQAPDLEVAAALQGTRKKAARRTKRATSATSAPEKPSEPLDPNVEVEDWDEATEAWIMRTRAEKAKKDVKRALLRNQKKDAPKAIVPKTGKHKQSQDRKSKDTPSKDKRKLKQGGGDTAAKPAPTKTLVSAPAKSAAGAVQNQDVASEPAATAKPAAKAKPSTAAPSPPSLAVGVSDTKKPAAATAAKPTSATLPDVPTGSGSSKAPSAPRAPPQMVVTASRAGGESKAPAVPLSITKAAPAGTGAAVAAQAAGEAKPPSSPGDKASRGKEDAANHREERPSQRDLAVRTQTLAEPMQHHPTKGGAEGAAEAAKGPKKSRRNRGKSSTGTLNLEPTSASAHLAAEAAATLPSLAPTTTANSGTSPRKPNGSQKKAKEVQAAAAKKEMFLPKLAQAASAVREYEPATAYVTPKAREMAAMLATVAPATVKKPALTISVPMPVQNVASQPRVAGTPPPIANPPGNARTAGQPLSTSPNTTVPPVVHGHAAVPAVAAAPHTVPNHGLIQTPVAGYPQGYAVSGAYGGTVPPVVAGHAAVPAVAAASAAAPHTVPTPGLMQTQVAGYPLGYTMPGAYGGMVVGADGSVGSPGVTAGMQMYDPASNMVYVNQMAAPMMQGSEIQYVPNSEGHLVPAMYAQPMQYIMNPATGEAVPMQYDQMMQVQPAYSMSDGSMSPVYVTSPGVPMGHQMGMQGMQYMPHEYMYQQPQQQQQQPPLQQQHPVRGTQRQPQHQALRAKKGGGRATSAARPKAEPKR